ncbi:uncharacterized protein [Halyomorpha halys]|uniref:uncharacterized protein n=1 Tax=Halyomorpha halys TaxID=286706 RepID=UPI0006D4D899|nr:uncharacterized protein LOC106683394 [Halyomorpha halys]
MEKEITRTLKQMRSSQANEICALKNKLEESRLQMTKSYNNTLFNLYAEIKRTKANLPLLSRNKQNLASRLTELKNTAIRMRKNLNEDFLELSEEAIRLEAMISEDLKIIKQSSN